MAQAFNSMLNKIGSLYLQRLQVPLTKKTFSETISVNPYFPSLYSLSSTFNKFNIENNAYQVEKDKFKDLPVPFMAYMSGQKAGDDFVLVTKISDQLVEFSQDGRKYRKVNTTKFLSSWKNVVFIANPTEGSGERDYKLNKRKETFSKIKQISFIVAMFFIILTGVLLNSWSSVHPMASVFFSLTELMGLTISSLLLMYEIDNTNEIVQSICTSGGEKTGCDAVLQSQGASVFGISWSEIGFIFFAFLMIFTLVAPHSFEAKFPLIAFSFLISASYIPFSIYYQVSIIHKWCRLCLGIQAVLFIGLLLSIIYFRTVSLTDGLNLKTIGAAVISLIVPIILWFALKPFFEKAKDAEKNETAYKRLHFNPELFNALLLQQPQLPEGWEHLGINIGNPAAEIIIVKVCNPYCGPCAKAHAILDNLTKWNKNIMVKIIFSVTAAESDTRNKPVKIFLAIDQRKDDHQTKIALDEWYSSEVKNYEEFQKKYLVDGNSEQDNKIFLMDEWCKKANIQFTPTLFIHGRQLPENYTVQDLVSILAV